MCLVPYFFKALWGEGLHFDAYCFWFLFCCCFNRMPIICLHLVSINWTGAILSKVSSLHKNEVKGIERAQTGVISLRVQCKVIGNSSRYLEEDIAYRVTGAWRILRGVRGAGISEQRWNLERTAAAITSSHTQAGHLALEWECSLHKCSSSPDLTF